MIPDEPTESNTANQKTQSAEAASLNAAQQLRLRVTCQYIDKLLGEIEEILHAGASKSPFPRYVRDLSLHQSRVLEDYIQRLRDRLLHALAWQGIPPPEATIPASRAALTHLSFIEIAIEELRSPYMKGSGEITARTAEALNGMVQELRSIAEGASTYLRQEGGHSLQKRIKDLSAANYGTEDLSELADIIERHGLIQFRAQLALLLRRIENQDFEIAFFGRVSSGKSSLLNALLERDVLPIGVNPITAIPTRLRAGTHEGVTIQFAHGASRRVSLDQLASFVTETANPANKLGITSALAEVTSDRVRPGIVFVDTPGLGSLATGGTRETLAYLPSADLAFLLIDAGATLNEDDLGTLRKLLEGGTPSLVLLSKSDLLKSDDRTSACLYVEQQIQQQLGVSITVHCVSSVPSEHHMVEQLYERELLPNFEKATALRDASIARKMAAFRAMIVATLEMQKERSGGGSAQTQSGFEELEVEVRLIMGRLGERAREAAHDSLTLSGSVEAILDRVTQNALRYIRSSRDPTLLPDQLRTWLEQAVDEQVQPIVRRLRSLSERAVGVLRETGSRMQFSDLPAMSDVDRALRNMPRFEWTHPLKVVSAWYFHQFTSWITEIILRRRIKHDLGISLKEQLHHYGNALAWWDRQTTSELEFMCEAYADMLRSYLHESEARTQTQTSSADALKTDLNNLREKLQHKDTE